MDSKDALLDRLKRELNEFDREYESTDTRERVLSLVPVYDSIRELGKSLIPSNARQSARDRILEYFRHYPRVIINEKEITVVAGISEWARRVRELRVQYGWKIVSGLTVREMNLENDFTIEGIDFKTLGSNDYILLDEEQDTDSAYRWKKANQIRKKGTGSKEKVLSYLRANINKPVTGEELAYVAKSSEWARRVRELRTEEGWPIVTKMSGNPSLPMGVYLLEADRQAPVHDRKIAESVRRETLRRDRYKCRDCHWDHSLFNRSDPRFLELHHRVHHRDKGSNEMDNLITLCNICHDRLHKMDKKT